MSRTDNFVAEIRPKDELERWAERNTAEYDACMGSDPARADAALECLGRRGFLRPDSTVLDIGAGTGILTLPLARRCAHVTALDISPAMQSILRAKASAAGLANIACELADWRAIDLVDAGMEQAYDIVVESLNTWGICDEKTLLKMNSAARQGCCMVSFTGGGSRTHHAALSRIILGRQLSTAGGNDIIFPFNIIYNLGGMPELTYSQVRWEQAFDPDVAVDHIVGHFWRFAQVEGRIRSGVEDYVQANLEQDGLFHERVSIPVAIMVWDAALVREALRS